MSEVVISLHDCEACAGTGDRSRNTKMGIVKTKCVICGGSGKALDGISACMNCGSICPTGQPPCMNCGSYSIASERSAVERDGLDWRNKLIPQPANTTAIEEARTRRRNGAPPMSRADRVELLRAIEQHRADERQVVEGAFQLVNQVDKLEQLVEMEYGFRLHLERDHISPQGGPPVLQKDCSMCADYNRRSDVLRSVLKYH